MSVISPIGSLRPGKGCTDGRPFRIGQRQSQDILTPILTPIGASPTAPTKPSISLALSQDTMPARTAHAFSQRAKVSADLHCALAITLKLEMEALPITSVPIVFLLPDALG